MHVVAAESEAAAEHDRRGGNDHGVADPYRLAEHPIGGHAHDLVEARTESFVNRFARRVGGRSQLVIHRDPSSGAHAHPARTPRSRARSR